MCKIKLSALFFLLTSLIAYEVYAQPAGYKSIEDLIAFKKRFSEEGKKTTSIRSVFVQEKSMSVLEEKIVSEGTFWYKQDRKVRIEYQTPFHHLIIMNGDQILIKEDNKESKVSTRSSKLFQQVNRIIIECVNGSILESKDYTSRVFENDKTYWIELVPVSKALRNFFQSIQVVVDKKDWLAVSITMNEPGGDNTVMRFSSKVLNEKLDDELFVR
jgi:outer membrane lipoprotein-sorting protein